MCIQQDTRPDRTWELRRLESKESLRGKPDARFVGPKEIVSIYILGRRTAAVIYILSGGACMLGDGLMLEQVCKI